MPLELVRRNFLRLAVGAAATSSFPALLQSQQPEPRTYTYKKAGGLEIKADVYRTNDETLRPIVVWIHGGALIMGSRRGLGGPIRKLLLDSGYVVVSIDYRLAPESKLPVIIEDVEDSFRWIRGEGAKLFHGDPAKVAVAGGSAGGYLTLVTGYRVQPRPTALVSFWGYGDLIGDWYSAPSPHPRHQEIKMSSEEAHRQVSGPPISDDRDRKGNGGAFYQHCRQQGIWPREVSGGWDPHKQAEKFYPYMPVRHVTKEYPPTLLIHGTADTDVPYEQSVMMAKQFKKHGVEHELISIEGGEHGLGGGDQKKIDAAYDSALAFLRHHLGA
jgi:acetyl esterase/lipase